MINIIKIKDNEFKVSCKRFMSKVLNTNDLFSVTNEIGIPVDDVELAIKDFNRTDSNIAYFGMFKRYLYSVRLYS